MWNKSVIICILLFCFSWNLTAQFGGGDGSGFNPFVVETADHLNNIKQTDAEGNYLYLDDHFKQYANIDLGTSPWNEGEGWEPIGNSENPFTGSYNGFGHTISNLTINRPTQDSIGLFGVTDNAQIQNIKIDSLDITGNDYVGGIVGYFSNNSTINKLDEFNLQSYTTGSLVGNNYVGGLIGFADSSKIRISFSTCNVEGYDYIGGIVGELNNNARIYASYSTGTITGSNDYIGGLVGRNFQSDILQSYSTANVDGSNSYIGGLVGSNENSTIENCYALGNVESGNLIGGLVGESESSSEIINCYSTGNVDGFGGNVEGFIGFNSATITNCYWDTLTSGQIEPGPGEGKSTDDMTHPYDATTYVDWDFENIWSEDVDVGEGYYNEGYPYLQWEPGANPSDFAGGDGSESNPYLIATPYHLNQVRNYGCETDRYFNVIANIDLDTPPWNEGEGWEPIGTDSRDFISHINGSYKGEDYTIKNLFINRPSSNYVGLFGATENSTMQNIKLDSIDVTGNSNVGALTGLSNNTTFRNIDLDNISVTGNEENIGGLVGQDDAGSNFNKIAVSGNIRKTGDFWMNRLGGLIGLAVNSIIDSCSVTGNIVSEEGGYDTGGLIGLSNECIVDRCFTDCYITSGGSRVGGLIGHCYPTTSDISNCYTKGEVESGGSNGGLIGVLEGSVTNCYAACVMENSSSLYRGGLIGSSQLPYSIENSYWDTEIAGISGNSFGTPRTSDDMTYPYTDSTYVGWDFGNIWCADVGYTINDGYPFLRDVGDNPVPVTLSSFQTIFQNGKAYILWQTESETNISHWNIYRSPSKNYGQANKVNTAAISGQGTTTESHSYSFNDESELQLEQYWYWLECIEFSASTQLYGPNLMKIKENNDNPAPPEIPVVYGLKQNYPNPFNPTTEICFILDHDSPAVLNIYNLKGQLVKKKSLDYVKKDNINTFIWNSKDKYNKEVSSGIYYYQLKTDKRTYIRKMILIK